MCIRDSYACLYFLAEQSWDDPFCLWLLMDGEKVSIAGGAWGDIPAPKGRLLDRETFEFLDVAMKTNGDFGVYGSVTGGLLDLLEFMEVNIVLNEDDEGQASWGVNATPRDGHGHFLNFAIDAKTGAIDGCMAGHLIPCPEPEFQGFPDSE